MAVVAGHVQACMVAMHLSVRLPVQRLWRQRVQRQTPPLRQPWSQGQLGWALASSSARLRHQGLHPCCRPCPCRASCAGTPAPAAAQAPVVPWASAVAASMLAAHLQRTSPRGCLLQELVMMQPCHHLQLLGWQPPQRDHSSAAAAAGWPVGCRV